MLKVRQIISSIRKDMKKGHSQGKLESKLACTLCIYTLTQQFSSGKSSKILEQMCRDKCKSMLTTALL